MLHTVPSADDVQSRRSSDSSSALPALRHRVSAFFFYRVTCSFYFIFFKKERHALKELRVAVSNFFPRSHMHTGNKKHSALPGLRQRRHALPRARSGVVSFARA